MSAIPAISIRRWAFWSAETEEPSAWLDHWSAPDASPGVELPAAKSVPSMQRRRLSKLSKMAVQLALECSDGAVTDYTIFGSRHGEVVRTRGMLDDMAVGETLSPTQFSQSVHNTSSGLFAILADDRGPATSIAAGAATFAACWTEAVAELAAHPERTVLLICADEVLPSIYAETSADQQCDHVVALLLESKLDAGASVWFERSGSGDDPAESDGPPLPMGPRVLAWWLGEAKELFVYAEGETYRWSRR
jgi:Beta-ketoacyl synthase, N-terminal domain